VGSIITDAGMHIAATVHEYENDLASTADPPRLGSTKPPAGPGPGHNPGNDVHGMAREMLEVTVAGWTATLAVIACLLALDWVVLGRQPRAIQLGAAARWSLFYISVSVLFGVVFSLLNGWDLGAQFFAGYVLEKSLSVDNLFVFVIITGGFAVPIEQQPKALTIGIAIALVLRAVFIGIGAALLDLFSFMVLIFGVVLLVTAVQLFRHRNEDPDVEDNLIVALARRILPISSSYDQSRIITGRAGRRMLTPLFLALLAIGTSDLLFAFDSIPAVFGVTGYAYIVFVVNAFALLGLRPLFFLISGLLERLVYLSLGLALILAFIGVKLVLEFAHHEHHPIPEVSTGASLAVIVIVLAVTSAASIVKSRRDPSIRAHPGSLRPGTRRPGAGVSDDRAAHEYLGDRQTESSSPGVTSGPVGRPERS
jgi:TerC family integral membrane protein